MKKLILVMIIFLGLLGCHRSYKVSYSPSFKDDPVRKQIYLEKLKKEDPVGYNMEVSGTKLSRAEYIDSCLRDWPFKGANGNWIPMRSSDPEPPDTIVDNIGYRRD